MRYEWEFRGHAQLGLVLFHLAKLEGSKSYLLPHSIYFSLSFLSICLSSCQAKLALLILSSNIRTSNLMQSKNEGKN